MIRNVNDTIDDSKKIKLNYRVQKCYFIQLFNMGKC